MDASGLAHDLTRLIDGSASSADDQCAAFATDYGGLIRKRPLVVVHPQHRRDVQRVVQYASRRQIPVAARGVGHSLSGQSLSEGIVINMCSLNQWIEVQPAQLRFGADAGVRWETVVQHCIRHQLAPPVLTGYPHVTIGGTHAAVGWGTSSARYGAQIDNCLGFEIITGDGDLLTCSADQNPELFAHALGGMGQFGIMTRIWHRLRRYQSLTRTYTLVYSDLDRFLADCEVLGRHPLGESQECVIQARTLEHKRRAWTYEITLAIEGASDSMPDTAALLDSLQFAVCAHVQDYSTSLFVQYPQSLPKLPRPQIVNPWLTMFLPWKAAKHYLEMCLQHLPAAALGGLHAPLRVWPARRQVTSCPMLRLPDDEVIMLVGMFPALYEQHHETMLVFLQLASDMGLKLGGRHHMAMWLPLDEQRWRLQFGNYWPTIQMLKQKYDPQGILNPGVFQHRTLQQLSERLTPPA